jgi:integrase
VRAFSDQEIQQLREAINSSARLSPADLVAWDCLICFGLRPKELQGLELQRKGAGLLAVVSRTKRSSRGSSGPRIVPTVPPSDWQADCHALLDRWKRYGLPPGLLAARSPGQTMTQQLRRLHMPNDLTSYGLRHAFALRLGLDLGLHVREAAELMGHSPSVHLSAYGRRLDGPGLLSKVQVLVTARAGV